MTTMTTTEKTDRDRKRRGVAFLKFGLAGAALLGIAAAATSAAWSDDAWFKADAKGATFELQGKDSDGTFDDADTEADALTISSTLLDNLVPNETRVFTVTIKNNGSVDQAVTDNYTWVSTGADFTTLPTVTLSTLTSPLTAGSSEDVTVTVSVPDSWAESNQGKAESLRISFTGTSVPTP